MDKEREQQPQRLTLEVVSQTAQAETLKHGHHPPTIIAQGSEQSIIAPLENLDDTHEGRVARMMSAGFAIGHSGKFGLLEDVFFISEAWMSVGHEPPKMSPSQDPNRIEVLLISGLKVIEHEAKMILFEMIRSKKGKLIRLKEFDLPGEEDRQLESPLLDAFIYGYAMGLTPPND
jgi:hypothetical protein